MNVATYIVIGIQVVLSLVLIVTVLMQSGNQRGLSGSIAGGAETFFGKNKGRTLDAKLKKWTSVIAILFLASSIVLGMLIGNNSEDSNVTNDIQVEDNANIESDDNAEADVEADTEADAEADADANVEDEADAETETDADANADAETEAE